MRSGTGPFRAHSNTSTTIEQKPYGAAGLEKCLVLARFGVGKQVQIEARAKKGFLMFSLKEVKARLRIKDQLRNIPSTLVEVFRSVRMVDVETVRRIARSLPESRDGSSATELRFYVRGKQFAWTYYERVHPKRPRQPRLDVLAVRCAAEAKEGLLASDPGKFFTTDHYRGFPAVLVYLDCVDEQEIRMLLIAAWRCQAPPALLRQQGRDR